MPHLAPDLVHQLSQLVAQYIVHQRAHYFSSAGTLSAGQKAAMTGFFSPAVLEETRLLVLAGERVANPDFYPMLRSMGFGNLPDQSMMTAITFSDTVVSHTPFTNELLFHELVHVEQYRQLGTPKFASLYVRGFLNGDGYESIPLEQNAYILGDMYAQNPAEQFSVAAIIAEWIAKERFLITL